MNKKTKGAIAAAAGGALLLGGAGSLAYWSSSAVIGGESITSGELKISECTGGEWADQAGAITDFADYLIVPGKVLNYTCDATITATGNDLKGDITADIAGITGDTALKDAITAVTTITLEDNVLAQITDANDGDTVTVAVSLTFKTEPLGETAQAESIDLAALELVLQQTAPH